MEIIRLNDMGSISAVPYSGLTGAQLKLAGEEGRGLFIAESLNVIESAVDAGYEPVSFLAGEDKLERVFERFGALDVPLYWAEDAELEKLTGYRLSRGVLCAMKRRALPSPEEAAEGKALIAVLEGINDPTNIGAIFRSAAALGCGAVLVGSSCCDPLHRRAARVSMGAVFRIPWAVLPCLAEYKKCTDVDRIKAMGFSTLALALCENAVSIEDHELLRIPRKAILLGSEGTGLEERTISSCDKRVIIPMAHGVDSLNVAAASAVAFWALKSRG